MTELLHSMLSSFRDPPRLHSLAVHLPIGISMVGVFLAIIFAATRDRSPQLRWAIVGTYALGAALALGAARTGGEAEDHLGDAGVTLSDAARAEFDTHDEMGQAAWYFMAGTALAAGLTGLKKPALRTTAVVLTLLLSLTAAGWIAVTAHHGGRLVYVHGVGVPNTNNNFHVDETPSPVDETPSSADETPSPADDN